MSDNSPPKSMHLRTVVAVTIVAIVAIIVGVVFAGPLRSAAGWTSSLVGFGREHDANNLANAGESDSVQYYTCGMHPWVILPHAGECPICHMDLTPIDADKFAGEITIDPVVVQNMGVRISPVVTGPLEKTIRTVGTIDYSERGLRDVNVKTAGWIEKLHVDFVGARVKAGDPLFELYSPQLYAAQEEYLLALKSEEQMQAITSSSTGEGETSLVDAARTRLKYFDISDQQIQALEESGKPSKTMTIRSPHDGVVIAKHANEGMKVDQGMQVFRIADLSKVWVLVTLYEYQLPYVEEGMRATMTLPYIPGQKYEGSVIYVYPYLDPKTREAKVRLEFDNPNNALKPGMFAGVVLQSTLAAERTLAPRSAVIDTGERQVAFVSLGEGRFEPRNVKIGVETGDNQVEVISGLKPGEMVVTSGQFLLDSEAKMREALAKMMTGDLAAGQKASVKVAQSSTLETLPDELADHLDDVISHYFALSQRLASDSLEDIDDDARELATAMKRAAAIDIPEDQKFWSSHQSEVANVRSNALQLIGTTDIAQARLQFAKVSTSLEKILLATGIPRKVDHEIQVLRCPMYREGQGGTVWMQPAGDVRNPYMGARMLGCFDERKAMPVTGGGRPTQKSTSSSQFPATPTSSVNATEKYPINFCLISGEELGSMGEPVVVKHDGRSVKLCCAACIDSFREDPDAYLVRLDEAAQTLGDTHGGQ